MNNKIAFESDGSIETGAKIIEALEGLGGLNMHFLDAATSDLYYFINDNREIVNDIDFPVGYTLQEINNYEPTPKSEFPQVMRVSDKRIDKSNKGIQRVVYHIDENLKFPALCYNCTKLEDLKKGQMLSESWKYAVALPEKLKLTKAEIAEKFGVEVENIEIVD
jgi:hypothetical protein